MRRRTRDERVDRLRLDRVDQLHDLARRAARWAADHVGDLDFDPEVPEALHDRARDNWRVLFSIADRATGHWPERARSAAMMLSSVTDDDDDSARVMLLGDIKEIFESRGVDRIATPDLLTELHAMEERPWAEWSRGRPMTAQALGGQLRPFGIRPLPYRDPGSAKMRGYASAHFADAWGRYL